MAKPIYRLYGRVNEKGDLVFYAPVLYEKISLDLRGKEFELILKEKHKGVSRDSHAYYRGGIIRECLQHEMFGGWTDQELHAFFADKFLSYIRMKYITRKDGSVIKTPLNKIQSTSDLSQKGMNEFIEKVIAWLANEGITVRSPEEYYTDIYKSETENQ